MSVFYISLCIILVGICLWFFSPSVMFGYIGGIVFGISLLLSVLQRLGKKSRKSDFAKALFYKLTKYQATIHRIDISKKPEETVVTTYEEDDYANIMDVLKRQMRVEPHRAKEATRFAMDVASNFSLQEKIRVALQWLDKPQHINNNVTDGG